MGADHDSSLLISHKISQWFTYPLLDAEPACVPVQVSFRGVWQLSFTRALFVKRVGVAQHGFRRAAEMREVCCALEDIGLDPLMSSATSERQEWLETEIKEQAIAYRPEEAFSWRAQAHALASAPEAQPKLKASSRGNP